jgi:hypothetical protein
MSGSASGEGEQNDTERFHVELMSVGIVEVEWEMRRTFSHLARARPYIFENGAHVNRHNTHGVENPDKSIG